MQQKDRDEFKERALRFAIDTNDLTEEISKQPGAYAYYAYTLAVHDTLRARAELKRKLTDAKIRLDIKRVDSRDGRSGGPTVGQIEAMVENNPEYQDTVIDVRNAEFRVQLLQADVNASAQKAAMLKLLAPMREKELRMKGYTTDGEETENR